MAMNIRRNPLAALLEYASNRGDEASSIGSVMTQLASPILKSQGVQTESAVQRGPVPQPTQVEFNDTSKNQLSGADPRLNAFMTEVEKRANASGINMQIAEAKRTADRQAALVADGTSPTMNSKHLTGNAADIYLVGPDGKPNYNTTDYQPVADIAKAVAAEQGLTDFQWGGDWKSKDAVHFQLGGTPNVNTSVSTMSAPQTGGGMPQTVEGILSTLYPDGSADEKKAHRKDILMGLSQGLSALSQGRPVDLSNIAANADQRRRQNVVDMRERERARAGASLIYSQTGDSDMAAAVAAGTMSINDVFSERERKRITAQADSQRLKAEQATGSLTDLIAKQSAADLGLSEDAKASAVDAIRNGAPIDQVLSIGNIAKVAEASRKAEDEAAAAAEQRLAAIERMKQHPDQVFRTAATLMELDPKMLWTDAIKSATPAAGESTPDQIQIAQQMVADGVHPTVGAALAALNAKAGDTLKPTGNMQDAQALVDSKAINAATGKEYTIAEAMAATILTPPAPPGFRYVIGPNNTPMLVQDTAQSTGAPAAAGGAPAAAGGAPAAGFTDIGTTAPGTVTATDATGAIRNAPIPGAPQPAQAAADLAATEQATAIEAEAAPTELAIKKTTLAAGRQQLEQTIAQEQDVNKKVAAEAQLADLKVQEAQLAIDELKASAPTDAEKAKVDLATAQANLESASLDNEKKHRELADAETGKAASLAKSLARADTGASVTTSTVSDILKATADWEAGMLGGTQRAGAALIPGSAAYNVESVLIPQLDANSIISNITAMKAASPSGATGFGATTAPELDALRNLLGKLDIKGDPALLRQNARVLNNYVLDSAYGTVEQIKANDKLTDAEKEFYGQRYDVKSGEIKYLGIKPIDEGVITMWDNPAEPLDPNALTPAELELYNSTITGGNN